MKFAQLPEPLVIGEEAEVDIDTGRQTALAVPLSAVITDRDGQRASWWWIKGLVRFRQVSLGLNDGKQTAVLEGLKEGELVVVNPAGISARPENPPGNQTSRPEGLMDLAIYDLKLHKGRFIATIIGVGLLFTIVLAMNGLYRGNILLKALSFIKTTNPDLWVVERYRGGPFNEQSILPEYLPLQRRGRSRRGPGQSLHLLPRGKARSGARAGISASSATMSSAVWAGPKRFMAGRGIDQAHYEMVAHKKLGVKLGDKVPLGLHTYTVVGLTQGSDRYGWGTPGILVSARRPGGAVSAGQ